MPAPISQILAKRVSFLLDLTVHGRAFRFTTAPQPVSVTDDDGASYVYGTGMAALAVTTALGAPLQNVGIALTAQDAVSWGLLVARGLRFDGARAVLRRHYAGQQIEQAEVIIRGRVVGAAYGDRSEPLTFSIERQLMRAGEAPSPDMRVGVETWPVDTTSDPDEQADGAAYPIIIGEPGLITGIGGASDTAIGSTPGLFVERFGNLAANYDDNKIMVAGHAVAASTVTLIDRSGGLSASGVTVQTTADLLGRTVSYVDFAGLTGRTAPRPFGGEEWAIAWSGGGGVPQRTDQSTAITGLGDAVRYLLEEWTNVEIDRGRMEAYRDVLNGYRVDFAITKSTPVWSWLRAHVASVFPVDWHEGQSGGYFRPWRLDATEIESVGHLDATPITGNVTRTSQIEPTGEVFNRITLHYALGGPQNRRLKRLTIQGDVDTTDTAVIASPWAKRSQTLLEDLPNGDDGIRPLTLQTDIVKDDATAAAILRQQIIRHSVVRRAVQVAGGQELDRWGLGDILTLTASDCDITSELAQIRAITRDDESVTFDLLLLDNPYISQRSTT